VALYLVEHSISDLTGNSQKSLGCFGREHGHFWNCPHRAAGGHGSPCRHQCG